MMGFTGVSDRRLIRYTRSNPDAVPQRSSLPDSGHRVYPYLLRGIQNEQAGMVLEGEFDMTNGGERRAMKHGMAYVIPGGVPHALHGGEGKGLVLDIFSPPREGYKERIAEAIKPAWETTGGQ